MQIAQKAFCHISIHSILIFAQVTTRASARGGGQLLSYVHCFIGFTFPFENDHV